MKRIHTCAILLSLLMTSCIKPVNHTPQRRWMHAQRDQAYIHRRISQPEALHLNLDQAIDMALACNLELVVKARQLELQNETVARQVLQMLPEATIGTTQSWRNRNTASSSMSLIPGQNPAPLSISSEQTDQLQQASVTWNLLNFGVSYFKSKQEVNRAVISRLEYCRGTQNIILEVVKSYWQVVTMREPVIQVDKVTDLTHELKGSLQTLVAQGTLSPAQAANQLSRILDLQKDAKKLRSNYIESVNRLKNLLGIPPDVEVTFEPPKNTGCLETLPPGQALQEIALTNRPELFQLDVEGDIHRQEMNEAFIKILPEIAPFIRHDEDRNRFLLYNSWNTCGIRALWNLLGIPGAIKDRKIAQKQAFLSCDQRILLSLGITTQVHLASALYYDFLDQYRDARDYRQAKTILYELALAQREKDAIGLADYTYALADLVLREFEEASAYAQVQGTLEQLNNSLGMPRYLKGEKAPHSFCEQPDGK